MRGLSFSNCPKPRQPLFVPSLPSIGPGLSCFHGLVYRFLALKLPLSPVAYLCFGYFDFRVAAWRGGVDGSGDKIHMHSEGGPSWSAEYHERYFSPL